MSRILDFIRDRWRLPEFLWHRFPWQNRTDPSFDPKLWRFWGESGPSGIGPNQIRSFIDPNKIITIAEPKEPVSQ